MDIERRGFETDNTIRDDVLRYLSLRQRQALLDNKSQLSGSDEGVLPETDPTLGDYRKRVRNDAGFRRAAIDGITSDIQDVGQITLPGGRVVRGKTAKIIHILIVTGDDLAMTSVEIADAIYDETSLSRRNKQSRVGSILGKVRKIVAGTDFEQATIRRVDGISPGYYLRDKAIPVREEVPEETVPVVIKDNNDKPADTVANTGTVPAPVNRSTKLEQEVEAINLADTNQDFRDPAREDIFDGPLDDVNFGTMSPEDVQFIKDYIENGRTATSMGVDPEHQAKRLERLLKTLYINNIGRLDLDVSSLGMEEQPQPKDVVEPVLDRPIAEKSKPKSRENFHYSIPGGSVAGETEKHGTEISYGKRKLWKEGDLALYFRVLDDEKRYVLNKGDFPEEMDIGIRNMERLKALREKSQTRLLSPRAEVPMGREDNQIVIYHGLFSEDQPKRVWEKQFAVACVNPPVPELVGDSEYKGFYRSDFARLLRGEVSTMLSLEGSRVYAIFRAKDSDHFDPREFPSMYESFKKEPGLLRSLRLTFSRNDVTPDMAEKHGFVLYEGSVNGNLKRVTPRL